MAATDLPAAHRDTRGAILTEATRLFQEHGVDGFSMRQIASAIGFSATTIYLYFTDKNDLMYAVCESGFAEFGASLAQAAASHDDPLDRLRALGDAYVDFALTHPLHYDVMFIRPKAWAIGAMVDERVGPERADPPSLAGLVNAVQAAVDAGALHEREGNVRELAMRLWAGLHGVAALAISMNDQIAGLDADAVRARAAAVTEALLISSM
jgi:AcrR family transcriptional regulator